jgi:putative mRNA 3-end processing factor
VGGDLLQLTDAGLYCPAGNFYVDPWRPVDRAIVTHGHADHARCGCRRYLVAAPGEAVSRARLGAQAVIDTVPYGVAVEHGGVRVSLYPAGHILGSAQVRVEHRGRVTVVSGDYKLGPDATCAAFEPVRCDVFVTESTFGLPIYRWESQGDVFAGINAWWGANRDEGRPSLLFGYALGKAQRLLSGLDPSIGPIYTHGAVEKLTAAYRDSGVSLPPTAHAGEAPKGTDWSGALVLAPPSAHGTPWTRKFGAAATGFASGWMRIRGARRRRGVDRGFVLSDHADWPSLLEAVKASGAPEVWVTHGYVAVLVRYLQEQGLDARGLQTHYEGERDDAGEEVAAEAEAPATEGGP